MLDFKIFRDRLKITNLLFLLIIPVLSCKQNIPEEIRAVWFGVPSNEYSIETVKYIDSLFSQYKQIHITHLFWFNNLKDCRLRESSFQLLDTLIVKAHQRGMKLHPVYSPRESTR